MEKRGTIKAGHNCLSITMAGDQSYVKIFDDSGQLIRESQSQGVTEIQQFAEPGKYKVESDGTIKSIRSTGIEMQSDEEILGLEQ